MDLNHQPRAYEHSSCPRRHPIPETTVWAISLGRFSDESLGLSPSHRKTSQHFRFHRVHKIYHSDNSQLDFDVKQVPWTHGQGIESTDPISKVSAGDDADTQCSGGAAIRHSEAGDSWPAKRYDSKAIHFPSGDQEAALSP